MSATTTSLVVFACIFSAAVLGMLLQRVLPGHHLTADTKDTVKLAMGFVATMAALILGLLVASAKDSYDKQSSGVTQMAAKAAYLDRLLANYGPEATGVRALQRRVLERITQQMWPRRASGESQLDPNASRADELFVAIQALESKSELQATLKSQAASTSLELGQLRWLEYEQAGTTISNPLLYVLVFWTAVLFASFGTFAPSNGTVIVALMLAALSVAAAIFLILELQTPFAGLLQIPDTPFLDSIGQMGR